MGGVLKKNINPLWLKFVGFQMKHRLSFFVAMFLVTCLSFYAIVTKLEIKTDFFEIYPPKHPYIQLYKEFRKMFGSANVLTIILERTDGKDIYNPETLKKINELTLGIMTVKGCNPIQLTSISHPKVKQIRLSYDGVSIYPLMWPGVPKNKIGCETFKKTVYATEGVRGFYVSFDDKSTALYAGFWEEGVNLLDLFHSVNKLAATVEDENHKCYIAGYPMLYAWISYYRTQVFGILCVTVFAMLLLLILYFRRLAGVMIPAVSGLVSAIWGLGFAAALGINLDPLLLVVPILLSARALSHSCQCLERFHQEFVECKDKEEAIVTAYSALYPPAMLAIITDGLGVLTIAIATIPLMQKLAYFSSFWIISIFLAVMVLNPIIISYFYSPSIDDKKIKKMIASAQIDVEGPGRAGFYTRFVNLIHASSGPKAKWVVAGVAVAIIFIGGYYSTTNLKVGDSSPGGAILYPDHPYNIAMKKVNTDFAGASRLIVVFEGKEELAIKYRSTLVAMDNLGMYMRHNIEGVGGTLSLTDLVRQVYRMYHEGSPKWDMVPQQRTHIGQMFFQLSSGMAPGEMDRFVSIPEFQDASVTAFLRSYSHDSIKEAIQKLKDYRDKMALDPESKVKMRVCGGILGILAAVNEEVEWSYWAILAVVFITTFLLCTFTYRSFKAGLILLIPLAVSQVICELIMLMLHIDLNIDSLPVTAIGIGVGIDYGIYLMSRLKEECAIQDSFEKARKVALLTTGRVIMFTALTLSIGVGFWVFSIMKFCAEMGLLILVLMVFNMIAALVLIPALSGIFKPSFVKRMGKEVLV